MIIKIKEKFGNDILLNSSFILDYIKQIDISFNFNKKNLLFEAPHCKWNEICNNKNNLLIIIKSDNEYIFGGFMKKGFSSEDKKKKMNNFFYFLLIYLKYILLRLLLDILLILDYVSLEVYICILMMELL